MDKRTTVGLAVKVCQYIDESVCFLFGFYTVPNKIYSVILLRHHAVLEGVIL